MMHLRREVVAEEGALSVSSVEKRLSSSSSSVKCRLLSKLMVDSLVKRLDRPLAATVESENAPSPRGRPVSDPPPRGRPRDEEDAGTAAATPLGVSVSF